MMNQPKQQFKLNRKGSAIVSLMIGVISVIISGVGYIYFYGTYRWTDALLIILSLIIPLIGLILGRISLSSTKKIALSGMILSMTGLLGAILFNTIILFWNP